MKFPIPFTKMSGTGNDFIIIDHRKPLLNQDEFGPFAKAVCRRKFSAGADGLILIEDSSEANFRWHFYNADGSVAEMCGNGARCAARFACEKKIAPAAMRFLTIAGEIRAEVRGESVKLAMTPPVDLALDQQVEIDGGRQTVHSINTGVPHAVLFVEDGNRAPVLKWGRHIRFHDRFQPAGTNVNFVQTLGPASLHARTYERGVEDETLACGTGAVASAIIAGLLGRVESPVTVTTSGGEQLIIYFSIQNSSPAEITDVFLEGPAHFVYEGLLNREALS